MRKERFKNKKQSITVVQLPDKFVVSLLLIITAIGFYLRLSNVGDISLWVDEYVHVMRAKNLVEGTGPLLTNDNNGILYTIFIIPLFYLFDSSAGWARFPSVVFGTGAVYLIYLLGKRLFNKNIGLISSVLLSLSLFNVYWARISRNYAIFMFFYLLMLFLFFKGFEGKEKPDSEKLLERIGVCPKYLVFFLLAFILSLLSHQLTFLFVFGVAVYIVGGQLLTLFNKNGHRLKNKYFVLSIISIIGLTLIFLPFAGTFVKGILGYFLPEKIVTWVIPNWEMLGEYYEKTPFKTFNTYFDVLKIDYPILYWAGILGIPASFFVNRKGAIFLFSMFVVPFLLMSFIFKDPSLPRYMIFIYPLFLVGIASFLYVISNLIYKKMFRQGGNLKYAIVTCLVPVVVILFFIQTEELRELADAEKKQGFIVDKKLSNWSFTNWKYPSRYVKANLKEGDLVLSTVPPATEYYAEIDSCIIFRQRYYDTEEKKYKNTPPNECRPPCANSYEDLRDILMNYERGWLLADYYFYNVMTDPRARALVCKYMDYHPQSNKDGGVLVFSWNTKNPSPVENQSMLYVLGKSETKLASDELSMTLKNGVEKMEDLYLNAYARSVSKNEMYVLVNKKFKIPFPSSKKQDQLEKLSVNLKPGILSEGKNTFRFFYNKNVKYDEVKGFSVHHLEIR